MDFDDLCWNQWVVDMHPEVLAKYQERFRYILVDEYQDTNHSQYLIVRALSDKFQNICVVGDDRKTMVAGANINNILNFQRLPWGKIVPIEQEYRSTKNIVNGNPSSVTTKIRLKSGLDLQCRQ